MTIKPFALFIKKSRRKVLLSCFFMPESHAFRRRNRKVQHNFRYVIGDITSVMSSFCYTKMFARRINMTVTDSTKKKIFNITIIVMSAIILLGIGFTVYALHADKDVIKIDLGSSEPHTVSFDELGLRPGESCEYILSLNSENAKKYALRFSFEDTDPELTLKDHAYIRIENNGEILYDAKLSDLFAQKDIDVDIDLTNAKKDEIKIIYYMPEDVGNEAQNAEADFNLTITATNG